MFEVELTEGFTLWLRELRDRTASAIITARLLRLQHGLFGDSRGLGGGISELRIHHGPGYRVYYTFQAERLIVLLQGGDKSSQERDIRRAKELAAQLRSTH